MRALFPILCAIALLSVERLRGDEAPVPALDVVTIDNFATGRKWTRIYRLNYTLKNTPLDFEVIQGYRKEDPESGVLIKVMRRDYPVDDRAGNPFMLRLDSRGRFFEFQITRDGTTVPAESLAGRHFPDDAIGNCTSARLLQVYIPLPITYRVDEADQVHPWRPHGANAIAYCIKRTLGQNRLQVTVINMDKNASSTSPQDGKMQPVLDVYSIVYGLNEPWPLEVHCARDNRYDFTTPADAAVEKTQEHGSGSPAGLPDPKPVP